MYTISVDLNNVFKKAVMLSLYASNSVSSDNGKKAHDDIAISEDDLPLCMSHMRRGAAKLFTELSAYSKGIEEAYKFDEQLDGKGNYSVYKLEMHKNWDSNLIDDLTESMHSFLTYFLLSEWYKLKGMRGLYLEELEEAVSDVRTNIHSRKTKIKRVSNLLN